MKYNNRPINFVLFGYYGFGNLGDELLASSLASELLALGYPKETLRILVGADSATASSLDIKPIFRKNIFSNIKTFLKTKIFLFGGGGIFQDENGIFTCLYYLMYEMIAKLCGCKIYMIGQSIGPLHSKLGRFLTNIAYKLASVVTVRDHESKNYLDSLSIKSSLHSDLVLLLNSFAVQATSQKGSYLLLNVRDRYDHFAELSANAARGFAHEHNLELKYIAFSKEDKLAFEKLIENGLLARQEILVVRNLEDFKQEAKSARFALGMRLHFCILSFALGVPITSCPYNPKVRNFAMEHDLPLCEDGNPIAFKQIMQKDLDKLASERLLLEKILTNI